jgi:hypothetical protein
MATNVGIYSSIWGQEFVDLPDKCPECGADFHKPESLIEELYMAVEQTCCINSDGELDAEETTYEDFPEAQYPTGFKCKACKHQVVAAEDAIE